MTALRSLLMTFLAVLLFSWLEMLVITLISSPELDVCFVDSIEVITGHASSGSLGSPISSVYMKCVGVI